MKINLLKCVKIFDAIVDVENEKFDFSTSHALVTLKRELEPHVQFYTQKEKEIVARYANRDEKGNIILNGNQFQMPSDKAELYLSEKNELNSVEVEICFTRKTISPICNVKPSALELLMEVFDFREV